MIFFFFLQTSYRFKLSKTSQFLHLWLLKPSHQFCFLWNIFKTNELCRRKLVRGCIDSKWYMPSAIKMFQSFKILHLKKVRKLSIIWRRNFFLHQSMIWVHDTPGLGLTRFPFFVDWYLTSILTSLSYTLNQLLIGLPLVL